jgi:hypothetical protein
MDGGFMGPSVNEGESILIPRNTTRKAEADRSSCGKTNSTMEGIGPAARRAVNNARRIDAQERRNDPMGQVAPRESLALTCPPFPVVWS